MNSKTSIFPKSLGFFTIFAILVFFKFAHFLMVERSNLENNIPVQVPDDQVYMQQNYQVMIVLTLMSYEKTPFCFDNLVQLCWPHQMRELIDEERKSYDRDRVSPNSPESDKFKEVRIDDQSCHRVKPRTSSIDLAPNEEILLMTRWTSIRYSARIS